mgnify:FL=1
MSFKLIYDVINVILFGFNLETASFIKHQMFWLILCSFNVILMNFVINVQNCQGRTF